MIQGARAIGAQARERSAGDSRERREESARWERGKAAGVAPGACEKSTAMSCFVLLARDDRHVCEGGPRSTINDFRRGWSFCYPQRFQPIFWTAGDRLSRIQEL
jgi:hypothetical protein